MRNRNEKIARAAHIKPRTEGTSNEISLSVLGAASQGIDQSSKGHAVASFPVRKKKEKGKGREARLDVSRETSSSGKGRRVGGVAEEANIEANSNLRGIHKKTVGFKKETKRRLWQETPSRVGHHRNQARASTQRLSVEDEIKRRKRARRRNRIIAACTVSVVMTIAVIGAAWIWHLQATEQQSYEAALVESLRQINDADEVVMSLDDIVNDPFSTDSKEKKAKTLAKLDETRETLTAAEGNARSASESLFDGQARQAANECISSINARQIMLQKGQELAIASEEAIKATNDYASAWQKVLDADSVAKEANKLTSSDEIEQSKQKHQEALDAFRSSRTSIEQVQTCHPQVKLQDALTYIDKRIESMGYAIDADEALIEKDKETAVEKNDAYNDSETQAATLALKLSAHPDELYQAAYSESNAATIKEYQAARSQAGTSDAVIRGYLGADGK